MGLLAILISQIRCQTCGTVNSKIFQNLSMVCDSSLEAYNCQFIKIGNASSHGGIVAANASSLFFVQCCFIECFARSGVITNLDYGFLKILHCFLSHCFSSYGHAFLTQKAKADVRSFNIISSPNTATSGDVIGINDPQQKSFLISVNISNCVPDGNGSPFESNFQTPANYLTMKSLYFHNNSVVSCFELYNYSPTLIDCCLLVRNKGVYCILLRTIPTGHKTTFKNAYIVKNVASYRFLADNTDFAIFQNSLIQSPLTGSNCILVESFDIKEWFGECIPTEFFSILKKKNVQFQKSPKIIMMNIIRSCLISIFSYV